ncbi:TonB-dependent receptor [Pedobacter aquatilis]|uniref:TonB-dependent receptor plug domain-containing protein n=1 Tax=Pedobacter aquatilis TaxID=351343 RepID=UPI00292FF630|nr:TonB-dependent receptor [Pedobacter aquatilis]
MKIYLSTVLSVLAFSAYSQSVKQDTSSAKNLREVVITGQYCPQTLKNSVYNVRTISAERIRLRAATNIQQVLNTELGFRFTNDLTLGTTDVSLMGMTGRNVKILLDGIPMVDRSDARESLGQIDINTVERIEIVEGPMSVIYGTDALAGVINIITKNAGKSLLSINARVQEETAGNEYEAFSGKGLHNQNLSVSWQKKGWSAIVGASHNDFGGWNMAPKTAFLEEFNARKNQWKPKEQWLGNTKIGYRNENFNIWYRLDGLNEDIDARFGINPNTYIGKLATYTTKRYTQQLQSEWKINSDFQITAVAGYTDLQRSTHTVNHNFTNNTEVLTTDAGEQDTAKFNATIFRATAIYKLNDKISFQPGFEYNRDAASGQRISGSPVINDYALFVSSEIKPIDGIALRPGLRFIKNSIYDAPPLIPSLNTKFSLSKTLDLRLGYARGFRAPALRELYYDFVDASHKIYGNPNLKAEESNSFNGSLAWSGIMTSDIQFRSTLAGFFNKFKNKIDFGTAPTDNSITTLLNISNFKTTGATLDNTFIYKDLQANVGVSYIGSFHTYSESSTFTDKKIVWSPEVTANVTYTINKINGSISLFYKYTGEKLGFQTDPTNVTTYVPTKISGFSFADLMLSKIFYKRFTLNAGAKNIFNVTQLNNTSTASGGAHSTGGASIPLSYGRSYVLGLTFNWNKN